MITGCIHGKPLLCVCEDCEREVREAVARANQKQNERGTKQPGPVRKVGLPGLGLHRVARHVRVL